MLDCDLTLFLLSKTPDPLPQWFQFLFINLSKHFCNVEAKTSTSKTAISLWTPVGAPLGGNVLW